MKICKQCEREFPKRDNEAPTRHAKRQFCSKPCWFAWQNKPWIDEAGRRKCRDCGQWKSLADYYYIKKTPHIYCKACCRNQRNTWNAEHRGEIIEREHKRRDDLHTKLRWLVYAVTKRAKKRGLDCTLTPGDVIEMWERQQGLCFYFGTPMTNINGKGRNGVHTNASLDRLDSSKGYVKGNVVLCQVLANKMKLNLTVAEFMDCVGTLYARRREVLLATSL